MRVAAASVTVQPIGFRLCGMVEDPPRPSPAGSKNFTHFVLHEQTDIPRDLAQRTRQQPAGTDQRSEPITLRVPRRIGTLEAELSGELLCDR